MKSTHVPARGWKILQPIFDRPNLLSLSYSDLRATGIPATCLTRVITHFNGRQIMLVARAWFLKIAAWKERRKREKERESVRLESEGSLNGGTPFEELASDDTQVGGRCRDSTGIEPGIMRRTYVCGLHNPW